MNTTKTLNLRNPAEHGFVKISKNDLKPGDYIQLTKATFDFDHINDMLRIDYAHRKENGVMLIQVLERNHPNARIIYGLDEYRWNYVETEFNAWRKIEKNQNTSTRCVIISDGKTTTAKMYDGDKLVKESVAKCSPDDEFNLEYGMHLAFHRLIGWGAPTTITPDTTLREFFEAIKK